MSLSRDQAVELIRVLLPKVQLHSIFLYPVSRSFDRSYLSAADVFNAIRNSTETPITEEEFNQIADNLDGE